MFVTNLFEELDQLRQEFNGYLSNYQKNHYFSSDYPLTNIAEKEDHYVVTSLIPGVNPKEVDITYENGILTISGERKAYENKEYNYIRQERSFGKFQKQFKVSVPVDHEKINASYKEGILTVTLTKSEAAKPKKIKVN